MESKKASGVLIEIEQSGSVEILPAQKMTLGSGDGDAVRIAGLPKAYASVEIDPAGGYRIRVNEPGQGPLLDAGGGRVSELLLREGVAFRLGEARIRCIGTSPEVSPGSGDRGRIRIRLRGRDPEGRSYDLELDEAYLGSGTEFVVGRNRNHSRLVVSNESVSRRHAVLSIRGGRVFLEDLGSSNGTGVNGCAIRAGDPPHPLRKGDRVAIGDVTFVVDDLRSEPAL